MIWYYSEKLVLKGGRRWCCDLLDWLVRKDQNLQHGEVILKRYTTTAEQQSCIVINIYAVERENSQVSVLIEITNSIELVPTQVF